MRFSPSRRLKPHFESSWSCVFFFFFCSTFRFQWKWSNRVRGEQHTTGRVLYRFMGNRRWSQITSVIQIISKYIAYVHRGLSCYDLDFSMSCPHYYELCMGAGNLDSLSVFVLKVVCLATLLAWVLQRFILDLVLTCPKIHWRAMSCTVHIKCKSFFWSWFGVPQCRWLLRWSSCGVAVLQIAIN